MSRKIVNRFQKTAGIALILLSSSLFANEGNTFDIQEESALEAMVRQMQAFAEGNHPAQKHFQIDEEVIIAKVKTPKTVEGIKESEEYRSYLFDPTYTVEEDIEDHKGRKIAAKGQKIDPLQNIEVLQDLILFDGTQKSHIAWAKKRPKAKWILVKGSPIEVEEKTDHAVYFDQLGEICRRFGIKKVPCKLSKKEAGILIEEIPVKN